MIIYEIIYDYRYIYIYYKCLISWDPFFLGKITHPFDDSQDMAGTTSGSGDVGSGDAARCFVTWVSSRDTTMMMLIIDI